jgi:hypothetical protein
VVCYLSPSVRIIKCLEGFNSDEEKVSIEFAACGVSPKSIPCLPLSRCAARRLSPSLFKLLAHTPTALGATDPYDVAALSTLMVLTVSN